MNYKEIELKIYENINDEKVVKETKNIKFRLTSAESVRIEEKNKMSVVDFIQNESVTMIITMLKHMRVWEDSSFGNEKAQQLYDQLIDDGWTYKRIIQDIIYETLVVSGFLEQSEWEEMKEETKQAMEALKKKRQEALAKI